MTPIWTLDARDSFMLATIEEFLDTSPVEIQRELTGMHQRLLAMLEARNFKYEEFRSALVPQNNKEERAFLFDASMINDPWYGRHIGMMLVPVLDRDHKCCVLAGDLIIPNQRIDLNLLVENAVIRRNHQTLEPSNLHVVYINNLSASRAKIIHEKLRDHESYVGYIPTTYYSPFKEWLSMIIGGIYLKIGYRWLCATDGDDSDEAAGDNVPGWPLEEHGYTCSSIRPMYFNHFLTYKIERAVYPGFDSDTRFALAAISGTSKEISDFCVLVDSAKAEYLRKEKAGSLARAGIESMSELELQDLIASKITRNYIYKLEFKHEKSFFNIVLEVKNPDSVTPVRLLASLEYQPADNLLRLITLY